MKNVIKMIKPIVVGSFMASCVGERIPATRYQPGDGGEGDSVCVSTAATRHTGNMDNVQLYEGGAVLTYSVITPAKGHLVTMLTNGSFITNNIEPDENGNDQIVLQLDLESSDSAKTGLNHIDKAWNISQVKTVIFGLADGTDGTRQSVTKWERIEDGSYRRVRPTVGYNFNEYLKETIARCSMGQVDRVDAKNMKKAMESIAELRSPKSRLARHVTSSNAKLFVIE